MTKRWRADGLRLVRAHPEIGLIQAYFLVQLCIVVWLFGYVALRPVIPAPVDPVDNSLWTVLAVPAMLVAALITQLVCAWASVPVLNHVQVGTYLRLHGCYTDCGLYTFGALALLACASALLPLFGSLALPAAVALLAGALWLGLGVLFMPYVEADLRIRGLRAARLSWQLTQGRRGEIARLLGELALLNLLGLACFGVGLIVTNTVAVGAVAACYADLRHGATVSTARSPWAPAPKSASRGRLRRRQFPRRG